MGVAEWLRHLGTSVTSMIVLMIMILIHGKVANSTCLMKVVS
jgi:hypothetical protein